MLDSPTVLVALSALGIYDKESRANIVSRIVQTEALAYVEIRSFRLLRR
jgi:hypothetical protein